MGAAGAVYALIALVVGVIVGWNARTARGANADVKVYKARIPSLRRARTRSGLLSLAVLAVTVLVFYDLLVR